MILLAEAYERNEQTDKMSALLLKILKERPSDYDVAKGLINFYNDNNEFEKSFEILELTEKYYASAQLFDSYNSLGYSISLYQGNKKEIFVSKYLSKIDERFYFEWTTQTISGKLSSQINDSVKTLEFYSRAMKLNDTIPFVFLDAALAFSNLKNYSKTNEILLEGKSKFKDDMQFDFYLCNSYLITKEYDKAHLYGKKLYEFDSMNVVFITLYASVLQEMKLYDESDRLYEQAIKIDPQDPSTNNNYAYSLSVRGKNLSKAERLSKFTVDTEPNNPAFLDTYGWIQYMLGNYDIALEYILKAIKNGEVSAEVFEHLGDIYIKLNKNDLALDAYMKSLELDKNLVNVIEKINILKN
jgi:tetratricopeptide (TPR) repeat protein